jgi:hypothetical protein
LFSPRQVWSFQVGTDEGQRLYVWEGIPPSDEFVCLGMVTTVVDKAPALDALRCVPRRWTHPWREPPELVWENAGTGGRHGSLWVFGPLGLLVAAAGAKPPTEGLFALMPDALVFDPKLLLRLQPSAAAAAVTGSSGSATSTPTKARPAPTPAPVVVRYAYVRRSPHSPCAVSDVRSAAEW